MDARQAVVIFALVVASEFLIQSTAGMGLCEFQEKFPGSGDSCYKKQGSSAKCPRNMVYENCTCRGTCEDPSGSSGCHSKCKAGTEGCSCPEGFLMNGEDCVLTSECPCFWPEIDRTIPNNQSEVNDNCTERRTCTNNQLVSDVEYQCSSNAHCQVRDGERQCYCNDGFIGDGQICALLADDCNDAYTAGYRVDGIYLIKPANWLGPAFNVSCVMTNDGGGWTVFQRRTGTDRQVNFYRNWTSYRNGFGSLTGDFWLGNEKLHYLTNQKPYKLRIDMLGSRHTSMYGEWSSFSIGPEQDKYRLTATDFTGNLIGAQWHGNNGKAFSTYDQDNDDCSRHHCAERHRGGWWYYNNVCHVSYMSDCNTFKYEKSYARCTHSNLNGEYNGSTGETIFWYSSSYTDYCNLNFAEMKIRPAS